MSLLQTLMPKPCNLFLSIETPGRWLALRSLWVCRSLVDPLAFVYPGLGFPHGQESAGLPELILAGQIQYMDVIPGIDWPCSLFADKGEVGDRAGFAYPVKPLARVCFVIFGHLVSPVLFSQLGYYYTRVE